MIGDDALRHLASLTEADLGVDRYEIDREIGRGGMGVVYLARDRELGREVALKVCPIDRAASAAARLRREAEVLARIEHPNIVPVHDAGVLPDGRLFYVMKLVRGRRLDAFLAEGPALPEALRLFERVCDAVAFAHAHGIIHRDLKPENIMVGAFGEALVMDWGLAKEIGDASRSSGEKSFDRAPADRGIEATASGAVLGTPAYMAPEQAEGDVDRVDVRADVYALGAILYVALSGAAPYRGVPAAELLAAVRAGPPRPLAEIAPAAPRALAAICARAMARDPDARYPGARELGADVRRYLDGLAVEAHRETLGEKAARLFTRYRVMVVILLAYLAMRALVLVLARR